MFEWLFTWLKLTKRVPLSIQYKVGTDPSTNKSHANGSMSEQNAKAKVELVLRRGFRALGIFAVLIGCLSACGLRAQPPVVCDGNYCQVPSQVEYHHPEYLEYNSNHSLPIPLEVNVDPQPIRVNLQPYPVVTLNSRPARSHHSAWPCPQILPTISTPSIFAATSLMPTASVGISPWDQMGSTVDHRYPARQLRRFLFHRRANRPRVRSDQ